MVDLSCSSRCAKYTLLIFNIIVWISGAILLGVGIWFMTDENASHYLHVATMDLSEELVRASAITLIVVGAVLFLLGFLGCCGAWKEIPAMLLIYAIVLGILLVLQLVAGILAVAFKDQILNILEKSMNTTVQTRYNQTGHETVTSGYDVLQQTMHCCGAVNGPSDWETSEWSKTHKNISVPASCCVTDHDEVFKNLKVCQEISQGNQTNNEFVYADGCYESLDNWIDNHAAILIGVAFGLVFVQLLVVILACCLKNSIKSQYEYV